MGTAQSIKPKEEIDLSAFATAWESPYVTRSQLFKFSGGLLNAKTQANLDSKGIGVEDRIQIGNKILYPVKSLVAWMEKRATRPTKGKVGRQD